MAGSDLFASLCPGVWEGRRRWALAQDMNCDGTFTVSDVELWWEWVFFLPFDGFLWALMQSESVATFMELTPDNYSGWGSGIGSAVVWLFVFGFLSLFLDSSGDPEI